MRFSLMTSAALLSFGGSATAQETVTFTYDALGRLVTTSTSGGTNNGTTSSYSYDSASNRTNVTTSTSAPGGSCSVISDGNSITTSTHYPQNIYMTATGSCQAFTILISLRAGSTPPPSMTPASGLLNFTASGALPITFVAPPGSHGNTFFMDISVVSGTVTLPHTSYEIYIDAP